MTTPNDEDIVFEYHIIICCMYLIYMLMCWLNDKLKSLFNSLYTFILRACANERSSPGPFVVIIYRSSICLFRAVYVLKIKCLRNFSL